MRPQQHSLEAGDGQVIPNLPGLRKLNPTGTVHKAGKNQPN